MIAVFLLSPDGVQFHFMSSNMLLAHLILPQVTGVRNLEVGGGGGAGESWLDMKGQGGIQGSALLEATCNVHPVTVSRLSSIGSLHHHSHSLSNRARRANVRHML
jgi:hypothetical protein